jgi:hypothetical protein
MMTYMATNRAFSNFVTNLNTALIADEQRLKRLAFPKPSPARLATAPERSLAMTTNLTAPGTPGNELQLQQAKAAGSKEFRDRLMQFRQVFGGEAGTRYFQAGISMQDAANIHGLTGDKLAKRVKELSLPDSLLPPEAAPMTEADYIQKLGPNLGKAAAAIERQNPALCGRK